MRWVIVAGLLATSYIVSCPVAHAQERPDRPAEVVSPEVSDSREVTFRVRAPQAESVRVVGGDMPQIGGGLQLEKGEGDVWQASVGPVDPGTYRYLFDIDGVATADPRNTALSESNTHVWSVVHVPGAEWMDAGSVPHGAIAEIVYNSKALGRTRRMHVYTPPGYGLSDESYPVFYLLHGASDTDDAWTTVGRAGYILDRLIAAGEAKPMVVVMPAGHTRRGPGGRGSGTTDEFAQDFTEDIMPYVEANYRLKEGREHRAIAGLSMGGAQTLNIAMLKPEAFAYVGVFSSGVFGRGGPNSDADKTFEDEHKAALENEAAKSGLKLFWFATGRDDFLVERSRATVELMKKHGFDVEYKETEGGHTWIKWRDYLREFAPKLFQE